MENRIKSRLHAGELQLGMWLGLTSPAVAEIAGKAGFDWCLIDAEQGDADTALFLDQLSALTETPCDAVIRAPGQDPQILGKLLDLGAQTLLVSGVNSSKDAASIVAATRKSRSDICLIIQIESVQAMSEIDTIAAVPGIDAVFMSPAELAADIGYPGTPQAAPVQAALAKANDQLRAAGIARGTVVFDPKAVREQIEQGVSLLGVGGDAILMIRAMRDQMAQTRALLS